VTYVGNVGAWWPAPSLEDLNAVTPQILAAHGFTYGNPADMTTLFGGNGQPALLSQTLAQASPAVLAAHGIKVPYAGFSASQTVAQALRPFPQFANIPVQGNPMGKTWYDALQVKMTRCLSHGLSVTSTFAWQKSQDVGIDGNTGSTVPNGGFTPTNYVNNVAVAPYASKSISGLDQPLMFTVFGSYQVPNIQQLRKYGSYIMKDWTVGTLLAYSSGLPIPVPAATTSLSAQMFQGALMNRVPGQPLYLVSSLNCHCYDPSTTPVLNPAAWTNPAPGTFSTSSPFYSDFRYQRHPNENINLGRTWKVKERATVSLRMEFSNFLNRAYYNNALATNPTIPVTRNPVGNLTGGFGYISTAFAATSAFAAPRSGTIVMRISF
jgi:hypothetical protein